jgi:hypothetical protein
MVCAESVSDWVPFHAVAELVGPPAAVSAAVVPGVHPMGALGPGPVPPGRPGPQGETRRLGPELILPLAGLSVLLAAGFAFFFLAQQATPMDLCRELQRRGITKDCTAREHNSDGYGSAGFALISTGETGAIYVCDSDRSYDKVLFEFLGRPPYKRDRTYGSAVNKVVLILGRNYDITDDEELSHFVSEVDLLSRHRSVPQRPIAEHPVRSNMCKAKGDTCSGAGMCSVLPSNPNNCLAGFNIDCVNTWNCATHDVCRADGRTGLCATGE